MTNMSSVSRATLAAWVAAAGTVALAVALAVLREWAAAALAAGILLPLGACVHALNRARGSIDKAMAVCEAAARGDLSVRVMGIRGHGNVG
ncbi:MAG TPA: chemotaxis protein, partial [Azospirillum sp.]|nr:chemotaxis protein [Azospirillum sp.]